MSVNQSSENLGYYWKKKTVVSFMLSIFVLFIHMSSFSQYPIAGSMYEEILDSVNIFFRNSFVLSAVPLFFVISGATYFRNYTHQDYKRRLISRAKSLLIPYLIWNTLNMLFEIATSHSFISNYFIGRAKFVISLPNILKGIFLYDCNGPFWFIFNLMCFVIISPLIYVLISKKRIAIPVLAVLIILQTFGIGLPETVFFEAESLFYYMLGAFIGKHCFAWFASTSSKKVQILAGVGILVSTAALYAQSAELFTIPDSINAIVKSAGAISIWIVADVIVTKLPQKKFMEDSFIVYAMHVNVSAILIKLFYLFLPKHPLMSVLNFFVCSLLTLVVISVFCAFMKRFLPRTYGFISGSRTSRALNK